jgi:hypothetical protein
MDLQVEWWKREIATPSTGRDNRAKARHSSVEMWTGIRQESHGVKSLIQVRLVYQYVVS